MEKAKVIELLKKMDSYNMHIAHKMWRQKEYNISRSHMAKAGAYDNVSRILENEDYFNELCKTYGVE